MILTVCAVAVWSQDFGLTLGPLLSQPLNRVFDITIVTVEKMRRLCVPIVPSSVLMGGRESLGNLRTRVERCPPHDSWMAAAICWRVSMVLMTRRNAIIVMMTARLVC